MKYQRVSADLRVGRESTDMSTESQLTCQPTLSRHIGRETEVFISQDPNHVIMLHLLIGHNNNYLCGYDFL